MSILMEEVRKQFRRKPTPLHKLLRNSDFILEIADARFPDDSRSRKLEEKIRTQGKGIAIVFNKADLVEESELKRLQYRFKDAIFVSARTREGLRQLRKFLSGLSRGKEITVGVIGYPNTGKSSIINVLKGSHSAGTSPRAGFTKGIQKFRVNPKVMMWDSPGIAPFKETELKLAIMGAKNPEFLRDVEGVAFEIIKMTKDEHPGAIAKRYGINEARPPNSILEGIAKRTGKLSKGGIPDTERAARVLINDWQKDRLRK